MKHELPVHVYYEETDLAGVVYYANYLKFIERGRTEYVRDLGVDQTALKNDEGIVFVVTRVEADYISPARFDDNLVVETTVSKLSGVRMVFDQRVVRDGTLLFQAIVTVASMSLEGKPTRLPAPIRARLHDM